MEKFADLFIWGAGEYGKRIFSHIGSENVIAFIDSSPQKIGRSFCKNLLFPMKLIKKNIKILL